MTGVIIALLAVIATSAVLRVVWERVGGLVGEVLVALTFPVIAAWSLGMPAPYAALALGLGVLYRAVLAAWSLCGGDRPTIAASGIADASTIAIAAGLPWLLVGQGGYDASLLIAMAVVVVISGVIGLWPDGDVRPIRVPLSSGWKGLVALAAFRVAPRAGGVARSFACFLRFETAYAADGALLIWRPWLTGKILRCRISDQRITEIEAIPAPSLRVVAGARRAHAVRRALGWRWTMRRVACALWVGDQGVRRIGDVTISGHCGSAEIKRVILRRGGWRMTVWAQEADGLLAVHVGEPAFVRPSSWHVPKAVS